MITAKLVLSLFYRAIVTSFRHHLMVIYLLDGIIYFSRLKFWQFDSFDLCSCAQGTIDACPCLLTLPLRKSQPDATMANCDHLGQWSLPQPPRAIRCTHHMHKISEESPQKAEMIVRES